MKYIYDLVFFTPVAKVYGVCYSLVGTHHTVTLIYSLSSIRWYPSHLQQLKG